jgi:multiple sugar transport system permease protein
MAQLERSHSDANAGALRWTYATRNYINVLDELLLQGRAMINTGIFVVLAVGFNLLLNPLAAYAMSRFQLPGTYKFLLILMATIAFPPMVAMIPRFLVLREIGLLNTFAALVLPLMVNGYLIFLLKGFFDSLPQELYEAARIDGASEMRMFFQITMALSKPILAVVALQAFNASYMMFLYALIVCPDQDMWILSVWLYQFQQTASTPAVFASVLIASIPTFIVFLITQRTIMRGIAIPTEG